MAALVDDPLHDYEHLQIPGHPGFAGGRPLCFSLGKELPHSDKTELPRCRPLLRRGGEYHLGAGVVDFRFLNQINSRLSVVSTVWCATVKHHEVELGEAVETYLCLDPVTEVRSS